MKPTVSASLVAAGMGLVLLPSIGQTGDEDGEPESLVSWKMTHFSPEELRDGTSADDRVLGADGLPNLIRYALGRSPRKPDGPPLKLERTRHELAVSHPIASAADDVSLVLEVSGDLENWIRDTDLPAASTTGAVINGSGYRVRRFPVDGPRFFRLAAERLIHDSDNDGIDDDQELAWFASIAHGPSDDPDQDGLSTADELKIGRSPHLGVIEDPVLAARTNGLEIFTPLE